MNILHEQKKLSLTLDQIIVTFSRLDSKRIDELSSFDPTFELLWVLRDIFESELSKQIFEMKSAILRKDLDRVGSVIHRFRSTCCNSGALRASEIAKKIEEQLVFCESSCTEIERLVDYLASECSLALMELEEHISRSQLSGSWSS